MNEREIIAMVEKRERAVRRLREAIAACEQAELTRDDILKLLGPLLLAGDENIVIAGSLFDYLSDGEASNVIRVVYGGLAEGATFSFSGFDDRNTDGRPHVRRSEEQIHALCAEADIGRANVKITREAQSLRVSIIKLRA